MGTTTGVVPAIPGRAPGDDEVPPTAGAPTELAALEAERTEKRHLLGRAAETAVEHPERTPLPAGCTPDDVPALLQRYYWSEPAAEVLGHDPAELAALALSHLELAEVRPQARRLSTCDASTTDGGSSGSSPTTCRSWSTR